eukprot:245766_1
MESNQAQTQDEAQIDSHSPIDALLLLTNETESKYDDDDNSSLRSGTPSAVSPREYPICPDEYPSNDNICNQNDDLLVLLDWDDTLFPTTVIVQILQNRDGNGFALVSDDDIQLLDKLGYLTLQLLTKLINKYDSNNIYIVTNSLNGWIADSLAFAACISKVYKEIELLLAENNITMQSAQSLYANKCNNNTSMDKNNNDNNNNNLETVEQSVSSPIIWKQLCFTQLLNGNKTKSSYKHIISIGDQWTDHHSVKQCINSLQYTPIHHIIKLKMDPNLNDMINEILYVDTCFNQIFDVIASKNNTTECIQPVIIDYHREEMKYHQESSKPEAT